LFIVTLITKNPFWFLQIQLFFPQAADSVITSTDSRKWFPLDSIGHNPRSQSGGEKHFLFFGLLGVACKCTLWVRSLGRSKVMQAVWIA